MGKRYRDYIEKEKELNVVLQQLSAYNYNSYISEDMFNDINNKIEFFNNIRKMIDYIKKDYSINTKDNIWCYELDGNVLWNSKENVKFIYENGEYFVVSIANENIGEFESDGYILCFMTYKDNKIRRIPDVTIEDVLEYKELNDNLMEIKSGNGKVNVFDKKLGQIIIHDVDEIENSDEIKGFFITKKLFGNNDVDFQFAIDNCGYIIGNLIDTDCCIYHISQNDRCNKSMYNEMLEKKFEEIRETYQEKGKKLVKK